MKDIPSDTYFAPLTGLRAIAAYMVYFHHFNPFSEKYLNGVLFGIINEMHIGVTIFFVLSGFLITHRYFNIKNLNYKKYFINRIARIYPIYFILTTLTFIIWALNSNEYYLNKISLYFFNITFLRGFFENINLTLVTQGWSLTVEETFYLFAPLCFLIIKKRFIYIFIIPFLFLLIGLLFVFIGSTNFNFVNFGDTLNYIIKMISGYGFFGSFQFLFNYTFFGRVFEFFVGIGLALIINKKFNFNLKLTYFGIFFLFISLLALYIIRKQGNYDFGIRHPLGIFINTFLLPLLGITPLILGLIKEETKISQILSTKLFIILGKSSFAFYLIHMGIIKNMLPVYSSITSTFVLHFSLISIISLIIWFFIEEPLNIMIRRIVK